MFFSEVRHPQQYGGVQQPAPRTEENTHNAAKRIQKKLNGVRMLVFSPQTQRRLLASNQIPPGLADPGWITSHRQDWGIISEQLVV